MRRLICDKSFLPCATPKACSALQSSSISPSAVPRSVPHGPRSITAGLQPQRADGRWAAGWVCGRTSVGTIAICQRQRPGRSRWDRLALKGQGQRDAIDASEHLEGGRLETLTADTTVTAQSRIMQRWLAIEAAECTSAADLFRVRMRLLGLFRGAAQKVEA